MEFLLPDLEGEQPPEPAAEGRLLVLGGKHAAIVDPIAVERRPGREDVPEEVPRRTLGPDVQRGGEAHLVLAPGDGGREHRPEGRAEDLLQLAPLELAVGRHRRRQLDDRMSRNGSRDSRPWAMLIRSSTWRSGGSRVLKSKWVIRSKYDSPSRLSAWKIERNVSYGE